MRPIDADALTGYVTEWYEYDLCHDDVDEYTAGRASAEHFVLEKIRELPTIDAIPVEWLEDKELDYRTIGDKMFSDAFAVVISEWSKEQEAR